MASGVVVSRRSPGTAVFSSGSQRSSRLTRSPSDRKNRVRPSGPPISRSRRLPAALSLYWIAAAHRSPTGIPVARCSSVLGEFARMSLGG